MLVSLNKLIIACRRIDRKQRRAHRRYINMGKRHRNTPSSTTTSSASELLDAPSTPRSAAVDGVVPEIAASSTGSSALSSLPSTIGPTPSGLRNVNDIDESAKTGATRSGSPVNRRSTRQRKETKRYCDSRNSISSSSTVGDPAEARQSKRRKVEISEAVADQSRAIFSPPPKKTPVSKRPRPEHAPNDPIIDFKNPQDDPDIERDIGEAFFAKTKGRAPHQWKYDYDVRYYYLHRLPKDQNRLKKLSPDDAKLQRIWPLENPLPIRTRTVHNLAPVVTSNSAEETSPKGDQPVQQKVTQQASRKGGKSHKGRRNGGAAGRDNDTPEPSQKPNTEPSDKGTLQKIRDRQAKVKRLFNSIAAQQTTVLAHTTQHQLIELQRKPTAHSSVLEYTEVTTELANRQEQIQTLIRAEYEQQIASASRELEGESEVIIQQHQTRVAESQKEHIRGAQGDLVLFDKAHRAAKDETGTNNGSEIEPYFPRYHEMPEPDARPRGYFSQHIQDEKPFKANLTEYDEQAQREVIDKDIVGPVQEAIIEGNMRHQENQEKQARLESLVEVSRDALQRENAYPVPRPAGNPQFALSRLADCAELITGSGSGHDIVPATPTEVSSFPNHHLGQGEGQIMPTGPNGPPPPFRLRDGNMTIAPATSQAFTLPSPIPPPRAPPQHMSAPPRRLGGPKREPGTITFTPAQTPDSDRFKNPPQPQPLPPGQHVYRPSSLQPHANHRRDSTGSGSGTNKIATTFVNTNPDGSARSQQASDQARANATRNQVQGAGPKGGRRILLPKNMQ